MEELGTTTSVALQSFYLLDTMMAGKPPELDHRLQPVLRKNLQAGSLV